MDVPNIQTQNKKNNQFPTGSIFVQTWIKPLFCIHHMVQDFGKRSRTLTHYRQRTPKDM